MNCNEFKKMITESPAGGFAGEVEHVADCAECGSYRMRLQRLDKKIAGALEIAVPPLLMPDLSGTVVAMPKPAVWKNPGWLALAASVVLMVAVTADWLQIGGPAPTLAEQVIAHLDHEPGSLLVTDVAVSDQQFAAVARPALVEMDRSIGLISYAMSCKINGHEVPHLVIQGVAGPVTILLMPHETVAQAEEIVGQSIHGVILPVGKGSIAIVGARTEELDQWREKVIEKVQWKT